MEISIDASEVTLSMEIENLMDNIFGRSQYGLARNTEDVLIAILKHLKAQQEPTPRREDEAAPLLRYSSLSLRGSA